MNKIVYEENKKEGDLYSPQTPGDRCGAVAERGNIIIGCTHALVRPPWNIYF